MQHAVQLLVKNSNLHTHHTLTLPRKAGVFRAYSLWACLTPTISDSQYPTRLAPGCLHIQYDSDDT